MRMLTFTRQKLGCSKQGYLLGFWSPAWSDSTGSLGRWGRPGYQAEVRGCWCGWLSLETEKTEVPIVPITWAIKAIELRFQKPLPPLQKAGGKGYLPKSLPSAGLLPFARLVSLFTFLPGPTGSSRRWGRDGGWDRGLGSPSKFQELLPLFTFEPRAGSGSHKPQEYTSPCSFP